MSLKAIKVSALVKYLKGKLDNDAAIQGIVVSGEISNFTNHRSGHWYFTLKDDKARINCVMFASMVAKTKLVVKDGDKVLVKCNTSVFETGGQLQLFVTAIKLDGLGDLYLKFEEIKKRLSQEGLFDVSHKKALPKYPFKIGLITGRNTAAREDVISTLSRRWPIAKVYELNVLVQGEGSIGQLIKAVKTVDQLGLDVILMVRGGGSIEDLWSFNDETLARAVHAMKTPIISGVGHEVDVTIVDYVVDKRAPTPTGAAELAVPNINDVKLLINNFQNRMKVMAHKDIENCYGSLKKLMNSYIFINPSRMYDQKQLALDLIYKRLMNYVGNIENKRNKLALLKNQFSNLTYTLIKENDKNVKLLQSSLNNLLNFIFNEKKQDFIKKISLLDAYSPLKIMERGYSLVYIEDRLINSVKMLNKNEEIKVKFKDGLVKAEISEVKDE